MEYVALCDYRPVTLYAIEFEGVVKYVGATSRGASHRIREHFRNARSAEGRLARTCPKLYDFIRQNTDERKYRVLLLEQCSVRDAESREQHFVSHYATNSESGLNCNAGGNWARKDQHYLFRKRPPQHVIDASVRARVGKHLSASHRAAIGAGNRKRKWHNAEPIRCHETGQAFPAIRDAAEALGVSGKVISEHLRGRVKRVANKYTFVRLKTGKPNAHV